MSNHVRVTMGLSLGASALLIGVVGSAVLALCVAMGVHASLTDGSRAVSPVGYAAAPVVSDEAYRPSDLKEADIEAAYGKLNKSATHEVKEGLLANMRARRQARQANRMAYAQVRRQVVYQVRPQAVPQNCPDCGSYDLQWGRPVYWTQPVYRQPSTTRPAIGAEPYPEIDPASCRDGSCELQRPPLQSAANPVCPDGRCPLMGSLSSLDHLFPQAQ